MGRMGGVRSLGKDAKVDCSFIPFINCIKEVKTTLVKVIVISVTITSFVFSLEKSGYVDMVIFWLAFHIYVSKKNTQIGGATLYMYKCMCVCMICMCVCVMHSYLRNWMLQYHKFVFHLHDLTWISRQYCAEIGIVTLFKYQTIHKPKSNSWNASLLMLKQ